MVGSRFGDFITFRACFFILQDCFVGGGVFSSRGRQYLLLSFFGDINICYWSIPSSTNSLAITKYITLILSFPLHLRARILQGRNLPPYVLQLPSDTVFYSKGKVNVQFFLFTYQFSKIMNWFTLWWWLVRWFVLFKYYKLMYFQIFDIIQCIAPTIFWCPNYPIFGHCKAFQVDFPSPFDINLQNEMEWREREIF